MSGEDGGALGRATEQRPRCKTGREETEKGKQLCLHLRRQRHGGSLQGDNSWGECVEESWRHSYISKAKRKGALSVHHTSLPIRPRVHDNRKSTFTKITG